MPQAVQNSASVAKTFFRRLTSNPHALKMHYWEHHFEMQSLEAYLGEVKDVI